MGLFDFFSSGSQAQGGRFLKKQVQLAQDKRAQSADRMQALQELREAISEAVLGLLKRFDFQYDKSIDDEQEKDWVYQNLVALGTGILPELRLYFKQTSSFSWPLKILGEIAKDKDLEETVKGLCEQNDPDYVRDPSKKIQLLGFMGEHQNQNLAVLLVPYLQDADEGVRFVAVESLLRQENQSVGFLPLVNRFLSTEETSKRIKMKIIEGFSRLGWSMDEQASLIQKVLPEVMPGATLDSQKRIKLSIKE